MPGITGEYAAATLPLTGAELIVVEVPSGSINLPRQVTTAQIAGYSGVNTQAGTSYTLQASDAGKIVAFTNASAVAVTVPAGLGAGFQCLIVQSGAGQVTLTAGAGATVTNRNAFTKTAGQNAGITLAAPVADALVFFGDGV